ncbi:4-hydroxy-tetrahydrodipicolinate synthase [Athalassotoga saccharophila]|uniref:4-hydroxy-tetrahydrodipicolinate synthase n=1 Tax=Athalassotoga saccharophila TaxID=1441386 RepID=UPI00137B2D06|nr:4-hydroxy-tetrahydrodipicolinate synthase [Athalassotoga saccharophila]BBJ28615.1 4-hydroxy-tetrahydrodipicolinate synthase [Athalassotoga saccharophila]
MFRGVGTAIITPFKDGELDMETYVRLVNFQIENGVRAIFVLGTTGESPSVENDEVDRLVSKSTEICKGKVEVIVGAGTNGTKKTVEIIKRVEKYDPEGVLVVTPYYNKPTQRGLYEHYKYISERTDMNVIIYNVPSRTGVNILPETVYKIASDCKNVRGLKEANPDINQIDMDILTLKSIENFRIYSGNDDSAFHLLCSGGDGIVSVASNVIPRQMQEMCDLVFSGNVEKAREIHMKYFNFFKALFIESNPIPVKAAMSMIGFGNGELRLPLVSANEKTIDTLKETMRRSGILKAEVA